MTKDQAAAILGIDTNSDYATAHKAYIAQARLVHPDRFNSSSDLDKETAASAMSRLNEAISIFKETSVSSNTSAESDRPAPSAATLFAAETIFLGHVATWDGFFDAGFIGSISPWNTNYNKLLKNKKINESPYAKLFLVNYASRYPNDKIGDVVSDLLAPFREFPLEIFLSKNQEVWIPGVAYENELSIILTSIALRMHTTRPYITKSSSTLVELPNGVLVDADTANLMSIVVADENFYAHRPGLAILFNKLYYDNPEDLINLEIERIYAKVTYSK